MNILYYKRGLLTCIDSVFFVYVCVSFSLLCEMRVNMRERKGAGLMCSVRFVSSAVRKHIMYEWWLTHYCVLTCISLFFLLYICVLSVSASTFSVFVCVCVCVPVFQ